ncbi:NAD dependent epimerase/dehydratase [Apiospora arundinis]|uniref:NAD dependent epimerase/dehydratase n=1 Tax=Apiospora arundinis TaxID=335852 RepID=A0ABR2HKF4_9PEZI
MSSPKILLTGATGYVGGTVLHRLLACPAPSLQHLKVSVLVRGEERADQLLRTYGADRVAPVLFRDYDETDLITELASQHDIVINAGSGFHPSSAEAMVQGLSQRTTTSSSNNNNDTTTTTTSKPWMLHTSGCSNISDRPLTGQAFPDRELHDADGTTVYDFEKAENEREWYPQRAAELAVLGHPAAASDAVGAVSIQAPCIFGAGEGLFQRAGLMVPIMMRYVVEKGYGFQLGDGTGVIDYVHVADLADLYVLCVRDVVEHGGRHLPSGARGVVFPTSGRVYMKDIAQGCLDAAFGAGVLPRRGDADELLMDTTPARKFIREVDLQEAATTTAGNLVVAEVGWAGHRATKGTVARDSLGWQPRRCEEAWQQDFVDELGHVVAGQRNVVTIDSCIAEKEVLPIADGVVGASGGSAGGAYGVHA